MASAEPVGLPDDGWDIQPTGVQGVVTRTTEVAGGFEEATTKYNDGMQGGAASAGSDLVTGALTAFAEHHRDTPTGLVDRTTRLTTGAVDATNAYLDGDLIMAAEAQRNAGL